MRRHRRLHPSVPRPRSGCRGRTIRRKPGSPAADGAEGEIDLSSELHGDIFDPLKMVEYFKALSVHPELHTIVWPNGADFAPKFLRSTLRIAA